MSGGKAAVSTLCRGLDARRTVGANLARWLFLLLLRLIKAHSLSKWLEVFRLIFACYATIFRSLLYNWLMLLKSALHIFSQGKYDYIRCQWIEGLGAWPRVTLSIIRFADVWCLVKAHKLPFIPIWGIPKSPEIQLWDWIYKIEINKFKWVIGGLGVGGWGEKAVLLC